MATRERVIDTAKLWLERQSYDTLRHGKHRTLNLVFVINDGVVQHSKHQEEEELVACEPCQALGDIEAQQQTRLVLRDAVSALLMKMDSCLVPTWFGEISLRVDLSCGCRSIKCTGTQINKFTERRAMPVIG